MIKIETEKFTPARRSDKLINSLKAVPSTLAIEPFPFLDEKTLALYRLLAEEERLAEKTNDDQATFDKKTIRRIVQIANNLAEADWSTQLVPLDEMLDIASLFASNDPPGILLSRLLHQLQPDGNSAWTARVAAALAYFSALSPKTYAA